MDHSVPHKEEDFFNTHHGYDGEGIPGNNRPKREDPCPKMSSVEFPGQFQDISLHCGIFPATPRSVSEDGRLEL